MLVAQCDSRDVLSQIKLAFDEAPCELVTVMRGLGTADEQIFTTPWNDLDRSFEPLKGLIYFANSHAAHRRKVRLNEPVAGREQFIDDGLRLIHLSIGD